MTDKGLIVKVKITKQSENSDKCLEHRVSLLSTHLCQPVELISKKKEQLKGHFIF